MCVQFALSVASSKRPSGVAAELEWLLGDAAMGDAFGATRPGDATERGCFPTVAMPESAR